VDEQNHNINYAIMIEKLLVNMRTPFMLDDATVDVVDR
jgi:hypothetical protein